MADLRSNESTDPDAASQDRPAGRPADGAVPPARGDWSARACLLAPNQPPRPYLGGAGIARLRGVPRPRQDAPEDFIASTTEVAPGGLGLTTMPDGRTLRDHLRADPGGYLGPDHVAGFGAEPALLVKLLDTAERLFVHFHPDVAFAQAHLGCRHGKSEAWIVTDVSPGPGDSAGHVYLGFSRPVESETVRTWVGEQSVADMLGALNRIPVRPGDTFFVPGGVPHAIGTGVTAVELQEPTDFSVLLERWSSLGTDDGHLGLGYETALAALDRSSYDEDRLTRLRHPGRPTEQPGVTRLFPPEADPFFRAERVVIDGAVSFEAGFGVLVVLSGQGTLTTGDQALALSSGAVVLVPYGAGPYRVSGSLHALRCLPPTPPGPAGQSGSGILGN